MVQSSTAYVGMDVHKDSIDLAIANASEARHYGRVGGDAACVDRAVRKLRSAHRKLILVYEAGLRLLDLSASHPAGSCLHGGVAFHDPAQGE